MNYFYKEIQDALQKTFGSAYEISLGPSSGTASSKECVMIKKKNFSNVQAIPLADFYEDYRSGYSMLSIVEDILSIYEAVAGSEDPQTDIPYEYEAVKNRLVPKFVSLSQNQGLPEKVPCIELADLDLLVIFYVELNCANQTSIHFMVTNHQLSIWNISKAAFLQAAASTALPGDNDM